MIEVLIVVLEFIYFYLFAFLKYTVLRDVLFAYLW